MILAYGLAFFCAPMVHGMEAKLSAGSAITPLTCQLDAELFESLTARLAALTAAGEKKLFADTSLCAAIATLKSTILGYANHRTILIDGGAVRLLADPLTFFYQLNELQLEAARTCASRAALLSSWDIIAHSHIIGAIESKTALKCTGLFDDPEIFFGANSALVKEDAFDALYALILGTYYLKQMNRLRISCFAKKGLISLPNENF